MGEIRNRMVIVHHYVLSEIEELREYAINYFQEVAKEYTEDYDVENNMVSQLLCSPVNGEYSFVIMGDCSKSGWEMSDAFEKARMRWVKENAHKVQDILVTNFGEGGAPAFIQEADDYCELDR